MVDLSQGFEHLRAHQWNKVTRKYLRRATEAGVVTEHDSTGRLVGEFYDLLQAALPAWAAQQHEPELLAMVRAAHRDPIEKFDLICSSMGRQCVIGVARIGRRPVAAVLYLLGKNCDIIWAPKDRSAGETNATTMLYADAMEAACANGCDLFHMGESGFSDGLNRFKRRLGAESYDYWSYRIEPFPMTKVETAVKQVVKRANRLSRHPTVERRTRAREPRPDSPARDSLAQRRVAADRVITS